LFGCVAAWSVWTTSLAQDAKAGGKTNEAVVSLLPSTRDFISSHRTEFSFGLNQVKWLQADLWENPRWQYVATLLYLALAFGLSKGLDWMVRTRLKAWASTTANQWDDVLVGLADGPVRVVAFVVLLHLGLQGFDWPDAVEIYLSRATMVGLGFTLVYVAMKTVDAGAKVWMGRMRADADRAFDEHFVLLVAKALKAVIVVVGLLTLLQNLHVDITALLGSVSVLGLALGLAAQDTVANLFGAVAVYMDRPFKVGDRIRVGSDVDGTVEEMGLRATRVRTVDGFLVTVPNKTVGNTVVTNIAARPTIRIVLDYGLSYDTTSGDVRRASELLREIFGKHPETAEVFVHFNRFADSALNLNVVWLCRTTDWKQHIVALEAIQLEVKRRFDLEGYDFAFPTQTVHLKSATGRWGE